MQFNEAYNIIVGKSIDKPLGSSYASNKPSCFSASSSPQASIKSNSKTRCCTCHGYGHLFFQCPTKAVAMVEKEILRVAKESNEPLFKEDGCDPLDTNLETNLDDSNDLIGIIRPLMVTY